MQMEIARWQNRAEAASVAAREMEVRCQAAANSSAATAANALHDARAAQAQAWLPQVSSSLLLHTGLVLFVLCTILNVDDGVSFCFKTYGCSRSSNYIFAVAGPAHARIVAVQYNVFVHSEITWLSMDGIVLCFTQVGALERELSELRQSRGGRGAFGLPSRVDIFSSLGLERWREERLLPTASSASLHDLEAASKKNRQAPRCALQYSSPQAFAGCCDGERVCHCLTIVVAH